ncbi:MAG: SprT-like domain-containing protein [Bacteroidetes bacterium]|nr:SprT-like domain-containing protein [Bacteroidota bacterium]
MQSYIPAESFQVVLLWIRHFDFLLKIKRSRLTKLGDYKHPYRGKTHEITVNENLNQYSFLITLVHEIAHLKVWNKYKRNTSPHGREWKKEFRTLLVPLIKLNVFPPEIYQCLEKYSLNPKASSCTDTALMKVLKKYDNNSEYVHLEDLPEMSIFRLKNGRSFIKGGKMRKRFKCTDVKSKKLYLISPVAEVVQTSLF